MSILIYFNKILNSEHNIYNAKTPQMHTFVRHYLSNSVKEDKDICPVFHLEMIFFSRSINVEIYHSLFVSVSSITFSIRLICIICFPCWHFISLQGITINSINEGVQVPVGCFSYHPHIHCFSILILHYFIFEKMHNRIRKIPNHL